MKSGRHVILKPSAVRFSIMSLGDTEPQPFVLPTGNYQSRYRAPGEVKAGSGAGGGGIIDLLIVVENNIASLAERGAPVNYR